MNKKKKRLKRASRTRYKIKKSNNKILVINKTLRHLYAQIIFYENDSKVLVSASTLEKKIKKKIFYTKNKKTACIIGKIIAKRAINKGIKKISFDRSGFKYHGCILSLAESARRNGLIF
nr:50S ribosomal protein L18 [Candidatus Annandia adelgestsuga]